MQTQTPSYNNICEGWVVSVCTSNCVVSAVRGVRTVCLFVGIPAVCKIVWYKFSVYISSSQLSLAMGGHIIPSTTDPPGGEYGNR